jgi:peptidoglycan/LPS O-acetylase OafA/YrhL
VEVLTINRIPTLDGWRCVAITMVLVAHLVPVRTGRPMPLWAVTFGVHGVFIFFVLSGFLITSRLQSELHTCGHINLVGFYVRRLFRIMPCAWAYLLVAMLLAPEHMHRGEITSCVMFFRNYVSFGAFSLTVHFWSLAIEEQFYLLWPGVFILVGARRAGWVALCGAIVIAIRRSMGWAHYASLALPGPTHTELCADALLIGCFAAVIAPRLKGVSIPALPLAAILAWCVHHYSPFIPLVESCIIALLLLSTSTLPNTALGRLLELRPVRYIGKVSYSVYIWQQLPAAIYAHTLFALPYKILGLTVLVVFSHYGLERPMIALGKQFERGLLTKLRTAAVRMRHNALRNCHIYPTD